MESPAGLDRRVLLASAAGLGLSCVCPALPRVLAQDAESAAVPEPRPMDALEKRVAEATLKRWNANRAKAFVGAGKDEAKWSALQAVTLDPALSRYVAMHLEYLERNHTFKTLGENLNTHRVRIYRASKDGPLSFEKPAGAKEKDAVYSGWSSNYSSDWARVAARHPARMANKLMQDLTHTAAMLRGPTVAEAGDAPPKKVGIFVRRSTFKDGRILVQLGTCHLELRTPDSRARLPHQPVIWPQGDGHGRGYTIGDRTAPIEITHNEGHAIIASFHRTPSKQIEQSSKLRLFQVGAGRPVECHEGTMGNTLWLIPRAKLERNTAYRVELSAGIQVPRKPVYRGTWTRRFTTGENDYGGL